MKKKKSSSDYKVERLKFLNKGLKLNSKKLPSTELLNENLILNNTETNSWFDIKHSNEFTTDYDIKFKSEKLSTDITSCEKINIIFNEEQKEIIFNWFEGCRIMYNETVSYFRKNSFENLPTDTNFKNIRTYKLKDIKEKIRDQYNVPSHTLDGAIKQACTAYKVGMAHIKKGLIRYFRVRYMKRSKNSQSMLIEKTAFKESSFFTRFLGKEVLNTNNFTYDSVTKDSMLHINKVTNRITLLVPKNNECLKQETNNFISIDPGTKPFLTCLTNNSLIEVGHNVDSMMRSKFKKIKYMDKSFYNNKKAEKKLTFKTHKKIYNKIDDLHWKTINYLIKQQPKNIIIGNWSTKSSVSKSGHIEKTTKQIMMKIRYYQFLQRLQFKCHQNGIVLNIVDESYTSKMCSHCGIEHEKLGANKTFNCPNCKICIGRDINSTRNMVFAK